MTEEQTNRLVDGVATAKLEQPHPERDVAIFEFLYGCGLRISELCGLLAEDVNGSEQIVRVRGKGKKERLVPIGTPALAAIRHYWNALPHPPPADSPVFLANPMKLEPITAGSAP